MKWETAVVELDKCLLLCLNCHAELHEELDGGNVIEIP
jgi:predicted HNH restriction endonuclease